MNQSGMKLRNGKLLTNNEIKKINSHQKIDSHEKIDSHHKFIESANKYLYLIRIHSDLIVKLNNVINLYEYILQNIDDFKKFYDNKNKKNKKSFNNFVKAVLNQVINLTEQCVNKINNRITSEREINEDINIIVIQKCINCMGIMWKVYKHIKLL